MSRPPTTITIPSLKPPMSASKSQIEYTFLTMTSPFGIRYMKMMLDVASVTGKPNDYIYSIE